MVAGQKVGGPVMTLAEAAGWLERRFGRRPNVVTVWRWATRGMRGVRLATISLGRFRYTTALALEQFISETSQPGGGLRQAQSGPPCGPPDGRTSAFTRAEIANARKRRDREKSKAKEFLRRHLGAARSANGLRTANDKKPAT